MCHTTILSSHYYGKRLDRSQGLRPEKLEGTILTIFRCSNCDLVYPNPVPLQTGTSHYEAPLGKEEWGERDAWHQEHFVYELSVLQKLAQHPLSQSAALDIGFGRGDSLKTLSAYFAEVHGLEPFKELYTTALQQTSDKLRKELLHNCDLEQASFKEAQFDFIFFEALQHLPDPGAGIKKAMSWLKPGGILYVEVPSSRYLFRGLVNVLYKLRRNGFVANTNPLHGNRSYCEFSPKSFSENGKLSGYELIFHQNFPCIPPVPKVLRGFFTLIMRLTGSGMQQSVWLRKL